MRPRPHARPVTTAVTVALALLLAGCGSATDTGAPPVAATSPAGSATPTAAPSSSQAPATPAEPAATAGAYLTKAEYADQVDARAGTKVVYFFHATWCPTCRATEKAIARDGIPAGLTLVKVDFDSENELRKKYGVTTQHTFVQVDPAGAELAKWTGSEGGPEILAKTV